MDANQAAEIKARVREVMENFAKKFRSGEVNPDEVRAATARFDTEFRSTGSEPASSLPVQSPH